MPPMNQSSGQAPPSNPGSSDARNPLKPTPWSPPKARSTSEHPKTLLWVHPALPLPPYLQPPGPASGHRDPGPWEGSAAASPSLGWDRKLLVSTESRLLCPGFPTRGHPEPRTGPIVLPWAGATGAAGGGGRMGKGGRGSSVRLKAPGGHGGAEGVPPPGLIQGGSCPGSSIPALAFILSGSKVVRV